MKTIWMWCVFNGVFLLVPLCIFPAHAEKSADGLALAAPAKDLLVKRFSENPIIRPEMLPGNDGRNINGPSLIRVPEWIPNPLGKYYLYFADHSGTYIRLAYADALNGPWKVYKPGTLRLEQTPDGKKHIASPDVHVDNERKELRMYFHCPSKTVGRQMTYLARSKDGLHFVAEGVPLGPFYFRVFRYGEYWYAMIKHGWLYRSKDGVTPFEEGPNPFPQGKTRDGDENSPGGRHVAMDLEGDTLCVYYTNIGDTPESILRTTIKLTPDWNDWRASPPELVLKPETEYEGVDLPCVASKPGKSTGREHAVRDPAIFKENGHTYLLYSVAGESGIGMAELISGPQQAETHIQVKETVVFDGNKGWEHNGVTYRLACGAQIAEMPNGDLLCWWLSGSDNEPSTDNNVLASRSTDRGKTWSEPYILIPAGTHATALTIMHVTPSGKVIAFGAEWPSELHYTVWHYFRMESTDNGVAWTEREPVHIRKEDNIMFCRPIRLQNGEYLCPTSFFEKRPQALLGSVPALAQAKSEAEALALPPDPAMADKTNKFATHLHGCSALTASDPELRNLVEHQGIRNRPLGLLESTVVQLNDGRIIMLMRSEYGGFLWRSESRDNGRTWSEAWQTDIPNPTSLAALIRLPDGRIALIHNTSGGVVGKNDKRDPMSIWLSKDELASWYIKQDVITGGQLAYPCPLIVDGKLVFSYDRNRRESRFVTIQLPEISEQ
ncbi:MAG TPA: exo-alpha-sialidase [Candidatus Hydrogenedentes bacterium]|nr:exo-alpha-sialidase [Candidatus Hydrogenedentota bacterium]